MSIGDGLGLARRRVLLGVTGGVAAYKAAELVRLLRKAGAEVQVVMTASAARFVGPLTFQALSGRPVREGLFDEAAEAAMGHIELARWAERVVIAPATADTLARLATGRTDDLLGAVCLATTAPLAVAPAMNQAMWRHPATQANVAALGARGVQVWGPAEGEQACGDLGPGRMLEPARIFERVTAWFRPGRLAGVRVLLTAGPTREAIDPVRFIGNRSSGQMGFAIAEALVGQGAEVALVAGPVALPTPAGVQRIDVETALEMRQAVMARADACDIFVATAAVADYRPETPAPGKIKKDAAELVVRLVRNPDILAEVAALPEPPFTLGFAAETDDLERHALDKLRRKRLNLIAANHVGPGARGGFEVADNALTLFWEGGRQELPLAPKRELALALVELLAEKYHAHD